MEMFDSLYEVRQSDRTTFGNRWRGPDRFSHGQWHLVAEYPKDPGDGDGFLVRLYECRMPARSYRVEAVAIADSLGEIRQGFALSTGSGEEMLQLAIRVAEEAARGMIGPDQTTPCLRTRGRLRRIREALELLDGLEPEGEDERAILSGAFEALVELEGRHGTR